MNYQRRLLCRFLGGSWYRSHDYYMLRGPCWSQTCDLETGGQQDLWLCCEKRPLISMHWDQYWWTLLVKFLGLGQPPVSEEWAKDHHKPLISLVLLAEKHLSKVIFVITRIKTDGISVPVSSLYFWVTFNNIGIMVLQAGWSLIPSSLGDGLLTFSGGSVNLYS